MYIGIDLGTSGVKLLLLSEKGEVKRTVVRKYETIMPKPLWTEQDPNQWFEQTMDGLIELVKGYEEKIRAISFSGQMHGMVLLDREDQVIRHAILWNDQRTHFEVETLNQQIGFEKIIEETGNIAVTGLTAPKVLWVYHNEFENFKRISKVMLPKDYLVYKLSGIYATDVSDVSGTLYYDVKNKRYSKVMMDAIHLDVAQMPPVFESSAVIGDLKEEIKDLLKIKHHVKIIIGGGDQALGAIGVGVVHDGETSLSLGTSGVVLTAMDQFHVDFESQMQAYSHANGKYLMMGVTLNAAGALNWWNDKIFQTNDFDKIFQNAARIHIEDTLYFLPYLSGERAPINDPFAQGVLLGIRQEHKKENIDLAVIEGISFNLKQIFENIKSKGVVTDKIKITGGGAKNDVWVQMLADILDTKVQTILIEEGPALGAGILAMVGDGLYPDVSSACHVVVRISQTFIPKPDKALSYRKKYQKYISIYPIVKQLFVNS